MAQRQRKIKKFIRKIGNNPNNTLSSEANDKLNIKRSNSNNENTQDEINSGPSQKGAATIASARNQIKPSKRRIIVPIRRSRFTPSPAPMPSSSTQPTPADEKPASSTQSTANDSSNESNSNRHTLSTEQKKKLFVKRRRITPKPLIALEPSIIEPSSSLSSSSLIVEYTPEISLELKTRLSTEQRTFTYVVTRVHDKQSETISSTFVRDKIKTLTDTITHTIQPTQTQTIARTSNVE